MDAVQKKLQHCVGKQCILLEIYHVKSKWNCSDDAALPHPFVLDFEGCTQSNWNALTNEGKPSQLSSTHFQMPAGHE